MDFSGLGGGVMVAIAAVLWLAYLMPSWFRRKEYLATELNAVRLQQTLRVMAETTELPVAVRAETTAKSVAEQQKRLRDEQARLAAIARAQDAAANRAAEAHLRETQPAIAAAVTATSRAARLRRGRLAATALLLASVGLGGVQASLMVTTGVATGAWFVLAASVTGVLGSFGMLNRLQAVARGQAAALAAASGAAQQPRRVSISAAEAPARQSREWTPVPVPKPLYISRPAPEARVATGLVVPAAAAAGSRTVVQPLEVAVAELTAAAAAAERALRAAQSAPGVTPFVRPAASRFATMGVIDTVDATSTDLDAVLRRRRA